MTTFWPGTKTPKSTGNGFDLQSRLERGRSIFYVPKTSRAEYEDIVRQRAKDRKARRSITIGTKADSDRRHAMSKANI